ncbi:putative polyol transporter 1 [Humulus lupulus]|uniref:putative polyol transporter 1 n=1 Tax=Humulus lupulus TaxID=3486 RepID=UPI002B416038|nr:putative polyol transporter 1 [Humulus lupulus]
MGNERANRSTTTSFKSFGQLNLNKYTFTGALLCSMTFILAEFDGAGISSAVKIFMQKNHNMVYYEFVSLAVPLIEWLVAGRISGWVGSRRSLLLSVVLYFLGSLITCLAQNYVVFLVGSCFVSSGIVFTKTVAPVYVIELSPDSTRGLLASFVEIFATVGMVLGDITTYFCSANFSMDLGWRVMLGIGTILSFLLFIFLMALPESPFWLVSRGKLGEAKRVLAKTSESSEAAELRLTKLKSALGVPEQSLNDIVPQPKQRTFAESLKDLLLRPSPSVRRALIAAVGLSFIRNATGVDALNLYKNRIMSFAGIKTEREILILTTAVRLIYVFLELTAGFLIDRIGRRPLLLASAGGMIPSLAGLGLVLRSIPRSKHHKNVWAGPLSLVMSQSCFLFFFIGLGPSTWVYCSEIFPVTLRAYGTGLGAMVNTVTRAVMSMTCLTIFVEITAGGYFLICAGLATLALLYIYKLVPETRDFSFFEEEILRSEVHVEQSGALIATNLEEPILSWDIDKKQSKLRMCNTFPPCRYSTFDSLKLKV